MPSKSTPNLNPIPTSFANRSVTAMTMNAVVLGQDHDATPLMILHGWNQSLAAMRPLGERLAWNRPVHVLDLPGFGQSPWPGQDWDTRDYALCVLDYLERTGLARIDLLGHSFGGRIGLRIASEWPERIRRLVLMDAAGLPRQRGLKERGRLGFIRALGKLIAYCPAPLAGRLRDWHRARYGSRDYLNAGILRGTFVKVVNEDQSTNAARIRAATLLLWGELDSETPVEMGRRFKALIRDSRLVVLPGRDHFPFLGGGLHLCAQIVDEFLLEPMGPTDNPQ